MICVNSAIRVIRRIVTDEHLDLYVLAGTALAFTVLGVTGVSDAAVLSSVILAMLAFLALSQIRSRRQLLDITTAQGRDPLSLLRSGFPDELISLRGTAASLTLIGISMARTIQGGSRAELRQLLTAGGTIQVLVVDPDNDELLKAASVQRPHDPTPERLRKRIEATLDELTELRESTQGRVEIRVASFVPTMGINILNGDARNGLMVLQHHEHRPAGEAAPIIALKASDGLWYQHFLAEAGRMWDDGTPWPTAAGSLTRSPRTHFQDDFGPAGQRWLTESTDLLITGVTRNNLVMSNYSQLKLLLMSGCQIRMLLVDPLSEAVKAAADRYYVERSVDIVQERVRQTLQLLTALKRSTDGALSVRLTSHPLAMGLIGMNTAGDRRPDAALFVEYYSYQVRGEPKFILQPADDPWFEHFLTESEALWGTAVDYALEDHPQP